MTATTPTHPLRPAIDSWPELDAATLPITTIVAGEAMTRWLAGPIDVIGSLIDQALAIIGALPESEDATNLWNTVELAGKLIYPLTQAEARIVAMIAAYRPPPTARRPQPVSRRGSISPWLLPATTRRRIVTRS